MPFGCSSPHANTVSGQWNWTFWKILAGCRFCLQCCCVASETEDSLSLSQINQYVYRIYMKLIFVWLLIIHLTLLQRSWGLMGFAWQTQRPLCLMRAFHWTKGDPLPLTQPSTRKCLTLPLTSQSKFQSRLHNNKGNILIKLCQRALITFIQFNFYIGHWQHACGNVFLECIVCHTQEVVLPSLGVRRRFWNETPDPPY